MSSNQIVRSERRSLSLATAAKTTLAQAAGRRQQAILVCDVSGSMDTRDAGNGQRRIDALRAIVEDLRRQFPAMQVIAFASSAQVCPGPLPEPHGGTALHLALDLAMQIVNSQSRIILISDGEPDSESAALQSARHLPRLDVFYVGPEGGVGESFLRRLADQCGGQYQATTLNQPRQIQQKIAGLLAG